MPDEVLTIKEVAALLKLAEKTVYAMAAAGERLLSEIRRDGRAIVGSLALVPAPEAA